LTLPIGLRTGIAQAHYWKKLGIPMHGTRPSHCFGSKTKIQFRTGARAASKWRTSDFVSSMGFFRGPAGNGEGE
jgi:hypothetical protein